MHTIFQCAERWELVEKNPIKLVRVKGGSKRQQAPRGLTPEQFCLLPPLIEEPYRTQGVDRRVSRSTTKRDHAAVLERFRF